MDNETVYMMTFTFARHCITIHCTYLYNIGSINKKHHVEKCLISAMQIKVLYVSTNIFIKRSHNLGMVSNVKGWMIPTRGQIIPGKYEALAQC